MKTRKWILGFLIIFQTFSCNKKEVISYLQQIFEPDKGMIYIPAGEFIMGSDYGLQNSSPAHTVYLDAYYIDENSVTNEEYLTFWLAQDSVRKAINTPSSYQWPEYAYLNPRHPIVGVTWNMATSYAKWAGKRLPTEAEWEKAAKGLTQRKYPWGDISPDYGGKFRANLQTLNFAEDGFSTTSLLDTIMVKILILQAEEALMNLTIWQETYGSGLMIGIRQITIKTLPIIILRVQL